MKQIEENRLNDFKKVLTYHIVSKIKYHFKNNYVAYYMAPAIWKKWKNHQMKYENKTYQLILKFNDTALSTKQVQSIFGKDETNKKWISYRNILDSDNDIKIFNKGTIFMSGRRFQIKQRFQLPFEYIKSIFEDKELLKNVLDASSDFYSDRQRRLIFTQINKQQKYHYKTNKDFMIEKSNLTDDEIAEICDDVLAS